jgi:hypothetical protein
MFLFEPGFTVGFGSRKEELVDKIGDSKSIFEKVRFFIKSVPQVFLPVGWDWRTCSAYMRLTNPANNAAIIGEAGSNIGRGGRTSMYLVDESAFVERQDMVDAALSQNTNCQIDISTVNGSNNAFYRKRQRFSGTKRVFIFDWRHDPRKNDEWYQAQKRDLDAVIVAQEIDRDYDASKEDAFISSTKLRSCVDAHKKLGFSASGIRVTAIDPADTGDAKAIVNRHGPVLVKAAQKTDGDIVQAIPWAYSEADESRADVFMFDADGLGASAIKLTVEQLSGSRFDVQPYRGNASVENPDLPYVKLGTPSTVDVSKLKPNRDMFYNFRAQRWAEFRDRVDETHQAIIDASEGKIVNINPDNLISFSSECGELDQLLSELARVGRTWSNNGKMLIQPKAEMLESPNLAYSAIMAYTAKAPTSRRVAKKINFKGWS